MARKLICSGRSGEHALTNIISRIVTVILLQMLRARGSAR